MRQRVTLKVPRWKYQGRKVMVTNYHPRPVIISLLRANVCSEIAGWAQEVSTSFPDDGRDLSLIASVSARQAIEGRQWRSVLRKKKVVIVYQSEKVPEVFVKKAGRTHNLRTKQHTPCRALIGYNNYIIIRHWTGIYCSTSIVRISVVYWIATVPTIVTP